MKQGYVLIGGDREGRDYQRISYALALSLKITQKNDPSISIITNKPLPKEWEHVFDHQINVGDDFSKVAFRSDIYELTPYDTSIHIESDSIVLNDISSWWDTFGCQNKYLQFASKIVNIDGSLVNTEKHPRHRASFKMNCLPYDLRTSIFWFKKNKKTETFFDMTRDVSERLGYYLEKHMPYYQEFVSFDLVATLASVELGVSEEIIDKRGVISFCHGKDYVLGFDWKPDSLLTHDCEMYVSGWKQSNSFHYQTKEWMTDHNLTILENKYRRTYETI
jgi:hypothetical protein